MTDPRTNGGAPRIGAADSRLARVEDALNLTAGLAIAGLMLMGVGQVLLRKVFNMPIFGYIDVIEQSAALFAFLGAAYTQRTGGHVRMDLLLDRLARRRLYMAEILTTAASAAVIGVIAWQSYGHFLRAWRLGDSTIDASLPVWPTKLIVPLALGVLLLRLLVNLLGYVRLVIDPDAKPVGIPRKHTVESQAKDEIRDALGTSGGPRA